MTAHDLTNWQHSHDFGTAHERHAARAGAGRLRLLCPLTPWLGVQPNLQWIRHPGGNALTKNSSLVGIRLDILL